MESATAIARRLAASIPSVRRRAVRHLATWLPSQPPESVSQNDLQTLWNGLFFAAWHAPNPLRIIPRIAALLETLPTPLSTCFFDAFVLTLRREWPGIYPSHLDKFHLLIRLFIRSLLVRMAKNEIDCGILSERLFMAVNFDPADGFSFYVVEILLGEVSEVGLPVEVFELVVGMFLRVVEKSADRVFVNLVMVCVFGRLLENGREVLRGEIAGERAEPGSEVERLGKLCLVVGLSKKLFESASGAGTVRSNRKLLFGLHEEFLGLESDLEKSGLKIAIGFEENQTKNSSAGEQVEIEVDGGGSESGDGDSESDGSSCSDEDFSLSRGTSVLFDSSEVDNVHSEIIDKCIVNTNYLTSSDEGEKSYLLEQFEKSAVEMPSPAITACVASAAEKKRKREKDSYCMIDNKGRINGASTSENNGKESGKKVRFSMKSNLVWKPHNPMPPQSLRLPPTATPRGSALKKGVPPGPIRESPISVKKQKTKTKITKKKSKKGLKSTSAVKRLKMLQSL